MLAVVCKNTSRLLSLPTAAFTCNCTKQAARTLWVLFALPALSRRPWLWPATVLHRLISGRPAYSPTTSYYIYNYPYAWIAALTSGQSIYSPQLLITNHLHNVPAVKMQQAYCKIHFEYTMNEIRMA